MSEIIQKVARAIDPAAWQDGPKTHPGCDADFQFESLQSAPGAIKATVAWLMENVSERMARADPGTCTSDAVAFYRQKFKAMLAAALEEMED